MKEQILILFSKWPSKGAKTRIKECVGPEVTERFCFACLDDTVMKMQNLEDTSLVIVSDTIEDSMSFYYRYGIRALSLEEMKIEPAVSASEKFHKIFEYFLKEYSKAILIPMDVPHISPGIIKNAFLKLDYFEHVYGPEFNGGVYLMGLRKLYQETFKDVRWSTENSCRDLIRNSKISFVLEMFFDLNTFEDIKLLSLEMLSSCPNLKRFIKSIILQKIVIPKEVRTP